MTLALRASLLSALLLSSTGCVIYLGPQHHGSGIAAVETRPVADFRRVSVRGSTDVTASVGGATRVEIEIDDNLLEFVRTEVVGDTLIVEMERGRYEMEHGLDVRIEAPTLEGIDVQGSADVDFTGVHGPEFTVSIAGSGDVHGEGEVDYLDVSIAGSGEMDLRELRARDADVSISGSGEVALHATRTVRAAISGSGDVRYRGGAELRDLDISGSGTVREE